MTQDSVQEGKKAAFGSGLVLVWWRTKFIKVAIWRASDSSVVTGCHGQDEVCAVSIPNDFVSDTTDSITSHVRYLKDTQVSSGPFILVPYREVDSAVLDTRMEEGVHVRSMSASENET